MTLQLRQIRQQVGRDLGLILFGTSSSTPAGDLTLLDTSQDSPLDPGDVAERLNGAGLLIDDGTNLFYRQNTTYTPATQTLTFVGTITLADAVYYEVHTEPILHPLNVWPNLVNESLQLIRRLSWRYILLTGRGYYDLNHWTADVSNPVVGPEQIRRLYYLGNNLLSNGDFRLWAAGEAVPDAWTAGAGAVARANNVLNYGNGVTCDATETLYQDIPVGGSRRKIRAAVWVDGSATAAGRLTLDARTAAGSQYTVTATATADGTRQQLVAEIELPAHITTLRVTLEETVGGQTSTFWAPMVWDLGVGLMRRIQPLTTFLADNNLLMYTPEVSGCAMMAALLPYPALSTAATHAADIATTTAPDNLIIAAVAVRVLSWLIENPGIADKTEYAAALLIWRDRFHNRAREHMRKLTKQQQTWEAGERPSFRRTSLGRGR